MTNLNTISLVVLIERIRQATPAPTHAETVRGIGDDAATKAGQQIPIRAQGWADNST